MQAEEGAQRRAHFEGIALPHAPRLRAAAWRWCGQRAAADDAVQETFLRAYRTFDSFRPGTNARAWLFTILYSVCANEHARNRVRRWVPLDETPESHLLRESERRDDPRDFEPNDSEAERELSELPEPFRSAVTLVDLDELSYLEAAVALGCPVGTLRSRLARGRRALAKKLAHLAPRLRGER
jgi:RNA polymerase sigma-70 factor (ECF subfamily)